MTASRGIACLGCGGRFPERDGPTHRYMTSSPACWAAFGRVLAREYSDPSLLEVHRLSVDAYAVQHPGSPSRQCIQSVGLHLIRLCLFLEHALPPEKANQAMLQAARRKQEFVWLDPPASLGRWTVADVDKVETAEAHRNMVKAWAAGALAAWSAHQDTVRAWVASAVSSPQCPDRQGAGFPP